MADPFAGFTTGFDHPARNASAVTPNDSTDLSTFCRAIYIGGDGNVKLNTVDGDTVTFVGLTAGSVLPVATARVHSTDTTATNIVALW